jgi:hypothetical protein
MITRYFRTWRKHETAASNDLDEREAVSSRELRGTFLKVLLLSLGIRTWGEVRTLQARHSILRQDVQPFQLLSLPRR